MSAYVKVIETGATESVELPTEDDGDILISTLKSQFPKAIGLRYKSESGTWRGLNVDGDVIKAPVDGWGEVEYYITTGLKRKAEQEQKPVIKKSLADSDLIVLGLPYSTTDDEMKTYFEAFGELESCEVKKEQETQKSKGFGFVKFKTNEAVESVLSVAHSIDGRRCEVRFPKREAHDTPTKLFVGRLPKGITLEEVTAHFSEFGNLTDVYIPTEFRGFGFVTYGSVDAARQCLGATHVLKGSYLNVCHPSPKDKSKQTDKSNRNGYYSDAYKTTS